MTMKKLVLPLILSLAFMSVQAEPASAGFVDNYKAKLAIKKEFKNTKQQIWDVYENQDKFTNEHKLEKLSELYAENFINADGFDKKVYFQLIKETWESYPDIAYDTVIRDIQIDGNYATVQTLETALATTTEYSKTIEAYGELRSYANCIYHLQKFGQKWLITSEQVLNEKSQLKYGDARFVKMNLSTPQIVNAGDEYTASLEIELDGDETAVASIDSQPIIHPLAEPEEAFRNLTADNQLERIFRANKDNINEYVTASIGIAKAEPYDNTQSRVYVSGIAFLITRVNVIPKNEFIKIEEENAQKAE